MKILNILLPLAGIIAAIGVILFLSGFFGEDKPKPPSVEILMGPVALSSRCFHTTGTLEEVRKRIWYVEEEYGVLSVSIVPYWEGNYKVATDPKYLAYITTIEEIPEKARPQVYGVPVK